MTEPYSVEIADRQNLIDIGPLRLNDVVTRTLSELKFDTAEISIAVVGDQEMHQLNRQFLDHDYPTDVLSFPLEVTDESVAGEIIVSSETAKRQCIEHNLSEVDELMLYVIHGTLHLAGFDDKEADDKKEMRRQEQYFMDLFRVGAGT